MEQGSIYERLVEAVYPIYGEHPGSRALHAKGICCEGSFTATPEAAGLTRAAHMQGNTTPVTVRFSNGGGVPDAPDFERDGRGMAVKFHLPSDAETDIVALSLPVFFVRTPEDFLELMAARVPDPSTGQPDMGKVGAFLAAHPEAQHAIGLALSMPIPGSYARLTYHGVHAFRFLDATGGSRYVRYRWEPEEGEASVGQEAAALGPDYLQAELRERLASGPARFRLHLQLAAEGDDVNDPTAPWPDDRPVVQAGVLEITSVTGDQEAGCEALVFDPARVTDGIQCSEDPILLARPGAYDYDVSIRRRYSARGN